MKCAVVCVACGHQWQLRHPLTNQRPADPAEVASAMECGVCPKCGYGHIAVKSATVADSAKTQ